MMSFGKSGAAIADEQVSFGNRKSNVAQKLSLLGENLIYGGSGNAGLLLEVYESCSSNLEKLDDLIFLN